MSLARKAAILVVFWCLLASFAWLVPGAYSEAHEGTEPAGSSPAAEATPIPTPSSATEPSAPPSPAPTPSVAPSMAATPTPAPEPTAPSRGERTRRPAVAPPPALAVDLSVSPGAVEVGEQATITAVVTNEGVDPATNAGVTISVPNALDVIGGTPDPDQIDNDPGGTSVNFLFGDLAPDDSRTVGVTVEGAEDTGAPVVLGAEARADGATAFDETQITVTEPEVPDVAVSDPSGPRFATVGQQVRYSITVKNAGTVPAKDVAVVYLVPSEVHVVGAGFAPGVDAVQVGVSGGKEDIVWVIDSLAPGKRLSLDWNGRVTGSGDLAAESVARVELHGTVADSGKGATYLARAGGTGGSNPTFEPVQRRIVTTERIEVPPPAERAATVPEVGAGSSDLPFTGADPRVAVMFALTLIALGASFVAVASPRLEGRRVAACCLGFLVLATACVGGREESGPDVVKGKTVTRDGPGDESPELDEPAVQPGDDTAGPETGDKGGPSGGPGAEGEPDDAPGSQESSVIAGPAPLPSPQPPETDAQLVRRVTTKTIEAEDLPIVPMPSTRGAGARFSWDDSATTAATGRSVTRGGIFRLTSKVTGAGTHLEGTVSIENTASRKRLQVDGVLMQDVAGFGALRGGSTTKVLNPGGSVTFSSAFRLPSGSYTTVPSFDAS